MKTITKRPSTWTVPALDRSVPIMRNRFDDWLATAGEGHEARDCWLLIVSELVANACQNSPPGATVSVEANRLADRIELSVRNPVDDASVVIAPRNPGPLASSGRGLHIVEELVDGLAVKTRAGAVEITCWLGFSAG